MPLEFRTSVAAVNATVVSNLRSALDTLSSKYAEAVTNSHAKYSIDGQEVDHMTYVQTLLEQIEKVQLQLSNLGDSTYAPFEFQSDPLT